MKTTLKQYWRAFDVVTKKWNELFYTAQLLFNSRAAVVHLNIRAGSTFPVLVCTVPSSMDRTSRCDKVDAVRLHASYRLNLLLLKGQRCVNRLFKVIIESAFRASFCTFFMTFQIIKCLFFEIRKCKYF